MNSEEFVKHILECHTMDQTLYDHVETTVKGICGILQAIEKNVHDPQVLKIVANQGRLHLLEELEKLKKSGSE